MDGTGSRPEPGGVHAAAMTKDTALIAASVAALLVVSVGTLLCSRRWRRRDRRAQSPSQRRDDVELGHGGGHRGAAAAGLDDAALAAYPTLLYSSSSSSSSEKDKDKDKDEEEAAAAPRDGVETAAVAGGSATSGSGSGSDAARCAVCLADYADGDELRRMPGCGHAFHRGCVDQWLRRRPTCPVCRAPPPPLMAKGGAAGSTVASEVAGSS